MRQPWKVLLGVFAVGVFCFNIVYSADNVGKTAKIKIVSAYCLNDKWNFQIHDAVTGKTLSLKLGKRNLQGYKVESFDQQKQIAVINTPRGRFEVVLQEAKLPQPEENGSQSEESTQENIAENSKKSKQTGRISMMTILRRLK